jgi:hypothetical protein
MILRKLAGFGLLLAGLPLTANAVLVDFEDLTNNGESGFTHFGDNVNSLGFNFASTMHIGDSSALASWTDGLPDYYTGSCSLFGNYTDEIVVMTKVGGGAFSVTSIDAADVFRGEGGQTVTLIGTRADSSTVTQSFVLGSGNLQTFALSGMTDIVSMSLDDSATTWFQFDNVNVGAVPEPATFAVLGIGALAILRRRRAR